MIAFIKNPPAVGHLLILHIALQIFSLENMLFLARSKHLYKLHYTIKKFNLQAKQTPIFSRFLNIFPRLKPPKPYMAATL
jgi:hypothetical protein